MSTTITPDPSQPPPENSNLWRGIVSIFVMAAFCAVTFVTMTRVVPESPTTAQIIGTLTSLVTLVVGYWMGSSAGSTTKSHQLAQQQLQQAQPLLLPSVVTTTPPPGSSEPKVEIKQGQQQ